MSLHASTSVGAVHLRVTDLDLARRFYTRMLGLRAHPAGDELVLTADGERELLRIAQDATAPARDPRTTGLYHFALLLPSRAELGRAVKNLARTQYQLDGLVDHTISEAVYLTDPEGNGIELACDYPRERWAPALRDPHLMNRPLDLERMLREADEAEAMSRKAGRDEEGPSAAAFRLSPGTVMGHVHLHVRDVQEGLAFYRDAIGFDPMFGLASAAFVSAGGYHHHLAFNTWAGPRAPAPRAVGLRQWTIELASESDRQAIVHRLRETGAPVEETDAGPIATDPCGNRVLLGRKATR